MLEVLSAFERVCGKKINYKVAQRRVGDVASCFADTTLAREILNWNAERDLSEMCRDAWRWQLNNPNGYAGVEG